MGGKINVIVLYVSLVASPPSTLPPPRPPAPTVSPRTSGKMHGAARGEELAVCFTPRARSADTSTMCRERLPQYEAGQEVPCRSRMYERSMYV